MKLTKMEREDMAQEYMRLVYYVAEGYDNYIHIKDELTSAGLIGLAKAVNAFDTEKGVTFTTFAHHCITNEINMYLRSENKPIRRMTNRYNFHSYDNESGSTYQNEDLSLFEFVSDEDILEQVITEETYSEIMKVMSTLPKDGAEIIEGMFGINRDYPLNQSEQAKELGMSQANISKKRNKYLEMLTKRCSHIQFDF